MQKVNIALLIDKDYYAFQPVKESVNLYVHTPLYFVKPWKEIRIYFGRQCCYSGYLYFWETDKKICTEFGILQITLRFTFALYPFHSYHFILRAYPVVDATEKL